MPLDNNVNLSDIIESLGGMQGINQKAELASVIGSPATASDSIATQITKIQDAKDTFADKIGVENTTPLQAMADGLVVGKKWASGIATPSSTTLPFRQIKTTTNNPKRYIEVTSLTFKPSYILIKMESSSYGGISVYREDIGGFGEGVTVTQHYLATGSYYNYIVNGGYNATVTDTGFLLPVDFTDSCKWIAFE